MNTIYKVCTRCVMDTTDPEIQFNENGVCNHCLEYEESVSKNVISGDEGRNRLKEIIHNIKRDGANKEYDCIIGVSGGVDSSFVAYKVKELGLRPLAVHLDNGWDSELAVSNIHNVLEKLDIDLFTHVIDWEEFKDLQLAFLKASTPDSEIPTDHAIFAILYRMAVKKGIKYVITGCNVKTETHLPDAWSQGHFDGSYLKSVHKQFGNMKLKTFPYMNFHTAFKYKRIMARIDILNYIDYVKRDAEKILEERLGWRPYGGKHYESIYTRFYQGYLLPKKFGFDKRKAHLSSLICSGEVSRDKALEELKKEPYPIEMQKEDKEYVIKKLGLTENKFEEIMNLPIRSYSEYPSYDRLFNGRILGRLYAIYYRLGSMYYRFYK